MRSRRWTAATAVRLCIGAGIGWFVGVALASPHISALAKTAAAAVIVVTIWRASWGIVLAVAAVPASLLMTRPPARVAELLVWSFLAAWQLVLSPARGARRPPGAVHQPLVLLACCAVASWAGYTIATAAGIDAVMLPAVVMRSIALDHLVFSSPEPETQAMLALLTGLAFFAAAATIARDHPPARRAVAIAVAGSAAVMAMVTVAAVLRQWSLVGYESWYLLRYVRGERFSAHLPDLNAAGSQYVLGGLIALSMAAGERGRRRWIWIGALVVMMPALWLSGSRSAALGALLVGAGLIPWIRCGGNPRVRGIATATAGVLILAVTTAVLVAAQQPAGQGSASNALRLREQFLITSTRMIASAPIYGVGIGHYHERSNEFMPPGLREVYRNENAHNYFAQQFAEMGIVGGVLFVWLVAGVVRGGWREAQAGAGSDAATLGLLAGSAAFLVTCVTGHPLLVPETALPFWAAFGALAGASHRDEGAPGTQPKANRARIGAMAIAAAIALGLVAQLRAWSLAGAQPGERGFYGLETGSDGRELTWMTRHGVFYARPQAGVLTIPLRPPDLARGGPFTITVEVSGHGMGTYELPPGRWTSVQLQLRERSAAPFRRIDLRANQSWTRRNDLPAGGDEAPRSVMVGIVNWQGSGSR